MAGNDQQYLRRRRNDKKSRTNKSSNIFYVIRLSFAIALALCVIGASILSYIIYSDIETAAPINDSQLELKTLTTYIYDSSGNAIVTLAGEENKNREIVLDNDIPADLKHAFVAVEDQRFYQHSGIDFKRIVGAVVNLIAHHRVEYGASTITQQVVRNITGDTDISLKRKVQEQWNAIRLERRMSKWQILEVYMNIIYMGNGYYGVESASKAYFNKDVRNLSLAECALLAGITNSPANYDPFTEDGRTNALKRQKVILKLMLEQKYINKEEYDQAVNAKIKFADRSNSGNHISIQSYFVDTVINSVKRDLMANQGMTEAMATAAIYNQGLKIYTTMDQNVQEAIDSVFTDSEYFPAINQKAREYGEIPEGAIVVIDPKSGEIKGLYGGSGEKKASSTLNRATQIERQPGSSFKPIAVYGPAVDLGLITPDTVINDAPVYMLGKDKGPYPVNFDHTYGGPTTIRNAIKRSVNVVAAKVWRDMLGPDKSLEYLKRVGIDRPDERNVSIAMGGLNEGVSPLQMAAAYVPFANKGVYIKPVTYTKVVDSNDRVLLENKQQSSTAYKESTATIMTDMLSGVVKPGGTAYPRGQIRNGRDEIIPTAGKTGTTNDNIDKWFVGYSPYYVTAVWYGYDNKNKSVELTSNEFSQAQKIWHAVMTRIHRDKKTVDF